MKATAKANVAWIKCPPGHGAIDGICKACLEKAITDAVAEKEKEIYNLHSVTLKTMDFRVSAAVTKETEEGEAVTDLDLRKIAELLAVKVVRLPADRHTINDADVIALLDALVEERAKFINLVADYGLRIPQDIPDWKDDLTETDRSQRCAQAIRELGLEGVWPEGKEKR